MLDVLHHNQFLECYGTSEKYAHMLYERVMSLCIFHAAFKCDLTLNYFSKLYEICRECLVLISSCAFRIDLYVDNDFHD